MAIRDLLLKIAGDNDDARRALAEVAKDGAEFARQEYEAILDANTEPAETALERAQRELRDYGRISVEAAAGVEIAKGEAQIQRLKTRLENLSAQQASPKVDAQTTAALLQLDRVQQRVDKLSASRAQVNVDVDRGAVTIIDTITQAVSGLIGALGSGGGGLAGSTAKASSGFISFGAVALPLLAILAAIAVTIGVALVGALAALVASLAAAAAAVGVLAIALAGALGPVFAVVIAAAARFAKIIQAFRAQSAATQQAQQQAAAGSAAVTAAAEHQETAARALADANQRLGQATTQAYDEMAAAAEAASDAVRGVALAEDQRDQARLNTERAVEDLQRLRGELGATGQAFESVFQRFSDVNVDVSGLRGALGAAAAGAGGSVDNSDQLALRQAILDVRKARNQEKEAIDGVSDAETNRARTQQRANQFARQGIAASEGYSAALRGVADAQRQVNAAAQQQGLAAAQAKAQVLTDDLSESELKLLAALTAVGAAVRNAFGPSTDAVLTGVTGALANVAKLVTALKPAFTVIGLAIAQALTAFSGELVKPEWITALNTLAEGGAALVGIFTADIFIPFLQILRDVAVAALPFLISGLQAFGALLAGLAQDAGGGGLAQLFGVLVDNLGSFLELGLALGAVFLAFFKNAAGPGKGLVDTLTKGALALANWLNSDEGMDSIRNFFENTLPVAVSFVAAIISLVPAIVAFAIAAAPIVREILDVFTMLLRNIRLVALIAGGALVKAFAIAGPVIDLVVSTVRRIPGAIRVVRDAVGTVGAAFKDAFDFAKRQVTAAIDFIVRTFESFTKTAGGIGRGIGKAIVGGIRSALNALKNVGKGIGNFIVGAINSVFELLNKIEIKVPKILGVGGGSIGFDIAPIPELAGGGVTTGPTLAQIGEQPGVREAVLPLTTRVFRELADAIAAQMRLAVPNVDGPARLAFAGAAAAGGRGNTHIAHQDVHLHAPAASVPDPRFAAVQFANEMARRS